MPDADRQKDRKTNRRILEPTPMELANRKTDYILPGGRERQFRRGFKLSSYHTTLYVNQWNYAIFLMQISKNKRHYFSWTYGMASWRNTVERVCPMPCFSRDIIGNSWKKWYGHNMVYVLHIHRDFRQQQQKNIWKC